MRQVHSLPCYESPTHLVPSQRLSLLLAVCCLAVVHGVLFLSLSVTSSLLNASLGEHISRTPTTPRLNGSWNAIRGRRVKLRLLYSLVVAEIANSSANQ
jgi:hypothetical protein